MIRNPCDCTSLFRCFVSRLRRENCCHFQWPQYYLITFCYYFRNKSWYHSSSCSPWFANISWLKTPMVLLCPPTCFFPCSLQCQLRSSQSFSPCFASYSSWPYPSLVLFLSPLLPILCDPFLTMMWKCDVVDKKPWVEKITIRLYSIPFLSTSQSYWI